MVIADENSYPILIDSVDTPISTDYFWVLDLAERDFKLNPLFTLEEFWTPVIEFNVLNYVLEAPADWNILVYSPETSQVDLVLVSELTKGGYCAFVFDHTRNRVVENKVKVVGYSANRAFHTPSFNKSNMICHPIGPDQWVLLAPADTFNKYIKDTLVGDFLP